MPAQVIASLEAAARRGELQSTIEVLLDELEDGGVLGSLDEVAVARARVAEIVVTQAATWRQRPTIIAADFYARILDFDALASLRARCVAELDARGPWLRALQPVSSSGAVAELRNGAGVRLTNEHESCHAPHFVSELELEFVSGEVDAPPQRSCWRWRSGQVEQVAGWPGPQEPPYPRFEWGTSGTMLVISTPDHDPRPLPWTGRAPPYANASPDGTTLFTYGRDEAGKGRVCVVDANALELRRQLEFPSEVTMVLGCAASDDLLVRVFEGLTLVRGESRWWLPGYYERIALSPSGRHVCTVTPDLAQVWDTHRTPSALQSRGELAPHFSPDCRRFVAGQSLFDGDSGELVARLDYGAVDLLEGLGRGGPWLHVGDDLVACAQFNGLLLFRARDGGLVEAGDFSIVPDTCMAWDNSGRVHARATVGSAHVELCRSPDATIIGRMEFGVPLQRIALSSTGELVAGLGPSQLELRRTSGEIVWSVACEWSRRNRVELYFEPEDRGIVLAERDEATSERVWDLDTRTCTQRSLAPLLPGWRVTSGPISTFVRESDGLELAVAASGPWVAHPRSPGLFACLAGLYELRWIQGNDP